MFAFVQGCHGANLYSRSLLHSRCISATVIRFENAASSSKVEKDTVPKEGAVKPKFYIPKAERKGDDCAFLVEKMLTDSRLERGDRRCPTRELNFTADTTHFEAVVSSDCSFLTSPASPLLRRR